MQKMLPDIHQKIYGVNTSYKRELKMHKKVFKCYIQTQFTNKIVVDAYKYSFWKYCKTRDNYEDHGNKGYLQKN